MKLKTKKLSASVARKIMASLLAGGLVCTVSFAFAADANGNSKTVTNENAENITANITGGSTTSGDANNNNLTVKGTDEKSVDANGYEILGGSTGSSTGNAGNNTVTLRNVKNISFVDGGIARDSNGNSNNNIVYIWNSELFNVHGGHTGYGSANYNKVYFYSGTVQDYTSGAVTGAGIVTYDGEASFNELYIYGGELNGVTQGGFVSGDGTLKITSGTPAGGYGKANNNLVEVYGGTVNDQLLGGYVKYNGEANGNTINIYGGTINGEILGGYVGSGAVTNNRINIYGGDLSNANIYAGKIGTNTDLYGSNNELNFHIKDITAKNIGGFDRIYFNLPGSIRSGDTILTLTDGTTDWPDTKVLVNSGGALLHTGDWFTLVRNDNGLNLDINAVRETSPGYSASGRNTLSHGIAWDNYVEYSPIYGSSADSASDSTDTVVGLRADVQERASELKKQIEALTEPVNSVKGMVDSGTDRILNWLPPEEVESKGINETTQFEFFMGAGGEYLKIDTGNGSCVKNKSGGTNIGAARVLKNRHGVFLFAPITDYGAANYKSDLQDGTHGGGNSQYFTAGLIARQWNTGGMYYEASFRGGRMKTSFTSDNFEMNGEHVHVSYNAHTPVYTGHVRLGWRANVSPQNVMDFYGIYSHNHISGLDAKVSQVEQTYNLSDSDSKRIRLGARLTRSINDHNRFYSGLAYQYDFSGDTFASYMGEHTRKVGQKGSSGMLEFGWQLKPTPRSAVMFDSALVGWVGKQKGLSIQCKLKKDF